VAAISPDGLVVRHSLKRPADLITCGFEGSSKKSFGYLPDPLGVRVRHFQNDLCKFRLAVGAQGLVAEATHDLKITVEPRDHQDLLKQLRRLWQRVKRAGLYAAGNEVVARALRCGPRHKRRLDFEKSLRGKIVANGQS